MYTLNKLPLFQQLEDSKNILLAGAGGGFDVYCAIPLFMNLKKQGKEVFLANYSFTHLMHTTAPEEYKGCYAVSASSNDISGVNYFPEKYLSMWLLTQGIEMPVYAFDKMGINPLKRAYNYLIRKHHIDTVILVDGGTDSLMLGDEDGLGTPLEDICSMAAVYKTGIAKKFLISIGFGIDHFHGVSHYRFLENVATMMKSGGYLGAFSLLENMDEGGLYHNAVQFANQHMKGMESIVSNSITSAMEGNFGDIHRVNRTEGSELWINPLMSLYWCFELDALIRENKYFSLIRDTSTLGELTAQMRIYRDSLESTRTKKQIPI